MIIGIAGTLGSGKGTVVEYLKTKGFVHYSSSGILKEMVREQGLLETRKNLSELADTLMKEYAGGIFHFSHKKAQEEDVKDCVLEAIHRVSEAEYVRSIGGIVIGVDADVTLRYDRIVKRQEGEKDNVTYEQFLKDAAREDEGESGTGPHIRGVIAIADYVITNDGSLEKLHAQIEEVLNQIHAKGAVL